MMPWSTSAHSLIAVNLTAALRNRLRGGPCRVFGSGMLVSAADSLRAPDATIVCARIGPTEKVANEPVIVFEVLIPARIVFDSWGIPRPPDL